VLTPFGQAVTWCHLPTQCNVNHPLDGDTENPSQPLLVASYAITTVLLERMQTTLVGKRGGRSPIMALVAGGSKGLLFLNDAVSKQQFLVDTGAEVCVLPATGRTKQPGPSLLAANGSSIKTYGTQHSLPQFCIRHI
jgi:hypothetical protein